MRYRQSPLLLLRQPVVQAPRNSVLRNTAHDLHSSRVPLVWIGTRGRPCVSAKHGLYGYVARSTFESARKINGLTSIHRHKEFFHHTGRIADETGYSSSEKDPSPGRGRDHAPHRRQASFDFLNIRHRLRYSVAARVRIVDLVTFGIEERQVTIKTQAVFECSQPLYRHAPMLGPSQHRVKRPITARKTLKLRRQICPVTLGVCVSAVGRLAARYQNGARDLPEGQPEMLLQPSRPRSGLSDTEIPNRMPRSASGPRSAIYPPLAANRRGVTTSSVAPVPVASITRSSTSLSSGPSGGSG